MNNFNVGQKVVCIWDGWNFSVSVIWPLKGKIYTIREIECSDFDGFYLRFIEITNPIIAYPDGRIEEEAFTSNFFRPLIERKTDISIFHKILKKNAQNINA